MRILGIDPGLNTTGYGVLEFAARKARSSRPASSAAKQSGSASLAERVREIHDGVSDVIASLKPEVWPSKSSTPTTIAPPRRS